MMVHSIISDAVLCNASNKWKNINKPNLEKTIYNFILSACCIDVSAHPCGVQS